MLPQVCHCGDANCLQCQVHGRVVSISGNKTYQCIEMRDFLTELAKKLKKNSTAWDNHQRMFLPQPGPPTSAAGSPLRTNVLYKHIEVPLCILRGCTLACAHTSEQAQHPGLRHTLFYLGELQTRLFKLCGHLILLEPVPSTTVLQSMLTPDSAVIAETGDSWFNCQKLKLPDGCGYEFQVGPLG